MANKLFLLWREYGGVVIFVVILLALYICVTLMQRRRYERQFTVITDSISAMADGEEMLLLSETLETLPSKVSHQLIRLKNVQRETDRRIRRERDNTQRLITEIAHQLRTPLANIKMYTGFLKKHAWQKEDTAKYVNAVSHSEEKLSFLVESFIQMSRLENQLIQIKRNADNLKETVLNAVFQLRNKAESKKITIDVRQSEKIRFKHDSNWLGEAVYNIVDNSVKYSPPESHIHITIQQNEMFTEISVRDYGMGIEDGEEASIFQRFYRGKKVTKEEGFGIGLYLSREIILGHGGFIKVKRKEPGLQVSIYLSEKVKK